MNGGAGMSVWSVLLASLGGAGRELLTSGEDLSDAIAQVLPRFTSRYYLHMMAYSAQSVFTNV